MQTPNPPLTGGCQCGAIRYALRSHTKSGICHCRMCQKAVGGPFFAWVASEDFAWTNGEPTWFRSSSAADRGFCPKCGTPLTFRYDHQPGHVDFSLGSLDRPDAVRPKLAYGVEGQLSWCNATLFDLPAHKTGVTGGSVDLTKIQNFQHPDHDQ